MDKNLVKVWNVPLKIGRTIRVATIEQRERKPSPFCVGCKALCCHGKIRPVLSAEEFLEKKFPMEYIEPDEWLKKQVPRAQWIAVLKFKENGDCLFWDGEKLKCEIWPNPPMSCLAYDCREDTRWEMKSFTQERTKEWQLAQSVLQK